MKKFKAFTLGEMLIVIGIVGVIATLLLPTLSQMQPDRRKVMFKKAYATVDRLVTELVNDDTFYPEALGTEGFDNTTVNLGVTAAALDGMTSENKFCRLFAYKVNTVDTNAIRCPGSLVNNKGSNEGSVPSFTTNDGIEFYIPNSDFSEAMRLDFDVNGKEAPNCLFHATKCSSPDRFSVFIAADGGIRVEGDLEKDFLKSTSVIKER